MKKLSLSILLLLLGASNAQAFSFTPVKWAQQAGTWAKENKKKTIVSAVALGVATYFGYKANAHLKNIAAYRQGASWLFSKDFCEFCAPKFLGIAYPIANVGYFVRASSNDDAHLFCDVAYLVSDCCGE